MTSVWFWAQQVALYEVCRCTENVVLTLHLSRLDGVAKGHFPSDWRRDGGG